MSEKDFILVLDKIVEQLEHGYGMHEVHENFIAMMTDEMNSRYWKKVEYLLRILNRKNTIEKCVKEIGKVRDKIVFRSMKMAKYDVNTFTNEKFRELFMRVRQKGIFADFDDEEEDVIGTILTHVEKENFESVIVNVFGYGEMDCKKALAQILHAILPESRNLYFNLTWVRSVCSEKLMTECAEIFATVDKIGMNDSKMLYQCLWMAVRLYDFSIDTEYHKYLSRIFMCKREAEIKKVLNEDVPTCLKNYNNGLRVFVHINPDWRKYFALFAYSVLRWFSAGKFEDYVEIALMVELMQVEKFPIPYFIPRSKIEMVKTVDDEYDIPQTDCTMTKYISQNFAEVAEVFENVKDIFELTEILPAIISDDGVREILNRNGFGEVEKICALRYCDSVSDAKIALVEIFQDVPELLQTDDIWRDKESLKFVLREILADKKFDVQKIISELRGIA